MTDVGASLTSARLVTPIAGLDVGGNGTFKINDVEIAYKATDSITTIVNRINASTAGVSAFYDPVQDRLRLSASQTGARTMTLQDTQGNFLAATGLAGATQQLGQNALFSIDSVNDGAQLSSSTNSVSGYVPGVTLDLKSASATAVKVTVGPGHRHDHQQRQVVRRPVQQGDREDRRADEVRPGQEGSLGADRRLGHPRHPAPAPAARQQRRARRHRHLPQPRPRSASASARSAAPSARPTSWSSTMRSSTKAVSENPQAVEAVLAGFAATLGAAHHDQHHRGQRHAPDPPGRRVQDQGHGRGDRRGRGEVRHHGRPDDLEQHRHDGGRAGQLRGHPGLEDHRRRRAHQRRRGHLLGHA